MSTRQTARQLGGLGIGGACLFLASHAIAGVSNPDYYFIDIADGAVCHGCSGPSGGRITGITGQLEGDIATDATFTYNGSAFGVTGTSMTGIDAQLLVGVAGTHGYIDPDTREVSVTLRMRIKFSGSVPTNCQTPFFDVTLGTTKTSSQWSALDLDPVTGSFRIVAEDFIVPEVTTTACGTSATLINSTLGFGSSAGAIAMFLQGSVANPQVPVP